MNSLSRKKHVVPLVLAAIAVLTIPLLILALPRPSEQKPRLDDIAWVHHHQGVMSDPAWRQANRMRHPFWAVDQDAAAIEKVVDFLPSRVPTAHVLVLGILPSKHDRWKSWKDRQIKGELAARYAGSSKDVSYVDLGKLLLTPAGDLNQSVYDNEGFFLHPNDAGQRLLAEAIFAKASPFEAPTRPFA
jgi:hypothetical protein